MRNQYIIPIFVPHLGCPNDCVFCNQRSISGKSKQVKGEDVKKIVKEYLKTFKDEEAYREVAFFGGSFTGIDAKLQEELLSAAYEYVQSGEIDSIRLSTRPDYIDKETLKRLKKYKVKTIELGVQSSNDYILKNAKRGHTFEDVKKASKLIRRYGFDLGHQMMVGLPESTKIDELNTAKDLAKLKPKMMRIYPVLVIKNTELAKMYEAGEYVPSTLEQAIETCKELYYFFEKKHIQIIRMGLQNTDLISNPEKIESEVLAGPYHEAFGQLVESRIWYDSVVNKIKQFNVKVKEVEIELNPRDVNHVVGHKKENLEKLKEFYDVDVKIVQNDKKPFGKFDVRILKTFSDFMEENNKVEIKK